MMTFSFSFRPTERHHGLPLKFTGAMMTRFSLLALLFLAACGADGAPEKPGVTVSGDAKIGVVVKP